MPETASQGHEQPACISPAEAASIVAVQEADFIQRLSEAQTWNDGGSSPWPTAPEERIVRIRFNRHPKEMPDALSTSKALQKFRIALEAEGHSWKLPCGA